MKKLFLVIILSLSVFVTAMPVYATDYTVSSTSDSDKDTTKNTSGVLVDKTSLDITFPWWWYSKSKVTSKGKITCTFDAKASGYTWTFKSLSLVTSMTGLGATFGVSMSGISASNITIKNSSATYKCTTPNLSYNVKTSISCWTGNYEQEATAEYVIKKGNDSHTILLRTEIDW